MKQIQFIRVSKQFTILGLLLVVFGAFISAQTLIFRVGETVQFTDLVFANFDLATSPIPSKRLSRASGAGSR